MGVSINVDGLTLVHTGSDGVSIATLPDVLFTPVGGPPLPYPNIAFSADLAGGTATVTVDGGNSAAVSGSRFATSSGGEPGLGGGLLSGTYLAEATWLTFSPDVKIEGRNACRLTDKMLHNHGNTIDCGGEQQASLSPADCAAMWKQVCDQVNSVLNSSTDPIVRNKAITASYAQMYLANPELKWAGMGAFVSKEAGCGMKAARDVLNNNVFAKLDTFKADAQALYDGLAAGNHDIFSDIYPNFLFYSMFGNDALQQCADYAVDCVTGNPKPLSSTLRQAFNKFAEAKSLLAKGDAGGAGAAMDAATALVAGQEQREVLQPIVDANPLFREAVSRNAGASAFPWTALGALGGAMPVRTYLTADCNQGPSLSFPRNLDLNNPDDRVTYAIMLMNAFNLPFPNVDISPSVTHEQWQAWLDCQLKRMVDSSIPASACTPLPTVADTDAQEPTPPPAG